MKNPARKNSRAKGAAGERELARVFRDAGCVGAMRGQQRSGLEQADVVGGPPGWHVECKRVESLNVWRAFEQSTRDAPVGSKPMVAMRRNRSPWLAVVDLRDFLELVRAAELESWLDRPLTEWQDPPP